MKSLIKHSLLPVLLLLSSASWAASTIETRIIGGEQSRNGEWPWMTALSFSSNSALNAACGASLIDQQWLMTAAHCMFDESGSVILPTAISAFVGAYDLANAGSAASIVQIIVHPDYNPTTSDNDIALLKLAQPVTGITPLAYIDASTEGDLVVDDLVTVIGWGNTSATTDAYPNILRDVTMLYVDSSENSACDIGLGGKVTENMMCAGLPEGGKDSCYGDSGGPLVFELSAGVWVQAGVVSWGEGCAQAGKYGVYSRVSQYTQWIDLHIQGYSITPSVDFGSWLPNLVASAQINITNNGVSAFDLYNIVPSSSAFTHESDNCGLTVDTNESCEINLSFTAASVGLYEADVTLSTSIGGAATITIPITTRVISEATNISMAVSAEASIQWALAGDADWSPVFETVDSTSSLQSGDIGNNQTSSVFAYFTLVSSSQTVYFDWRACSEPDFDFLELWVDNQKVDALSGNEEWQRNSVNLSGVGNHVIEWRYNKDYLYSYDSDAGWLDNIYFDNSSVIPTHTSSCNLNINDVPVPDPVLDLEPSFFVPVSAGAISPWFSLGLIVPLFMRRRLTR